MFFTYVYLLRVPILCGLFMGIFPLLALPLHAQTTSLLGGMFDLQFWRVAVVAGISVFLAFSCAVTTELVLVYGHLRLWAPAIPVWWGDYVFYRNWFQLRRRTAVVLAFYGCCSVSLCTGLLIGCWRNGSQGGWGVAAGSAAALSFVAWVRIFWRDKREGLIAKSLRAVVRWTPDGYFDNCGELYPAHAAAVVAGLLCYGFYALFGAGKYFSMRGWLYPAPATDNNPLIPTLGCILLLVMVLCWFFAGFAFLLDRYRVPFLALFATLVWYTGAWVEADHTFSVTPAPGPPPKLLPADVLGTSGNRVILVAASGGGIQASAWAARVLGGTYEYLETYGLADQYAQAIRVVSSVSGGSLGAMYFINAYENGTLPKGRLQERLYLPAGRSSLDEVAWGLVYPDFVRLFLPAIGWPDRGWATEYAWKRAAMRSNGEDTDKSPLNQPLASWRDDVRYGKRPAVLFNTTLVDTGSRMVLPTADLEHSTAGRQSFYDRAFFPNSDTSIVTAARLSASFPYVLPAARVAGEEPKRLRYHFVDGGYYDNFGISTMGEWIEQALPAARQRDMLLIQVRGALPPSDTQAAGGQGFFFQMRAPLTTLFNFQGATQIAHNANELRLLCEVAAAKEVRLSSVVFEWPRGEDAPLSWHLTEGQQRKIVSTFESGYDFQKQRIRDFLRGTPQVSDCSDFGDKPR